MVWLKMKAVVKKLVFYKAVLALVILGFGTLVFWLSESQVFTIKKVYCKTQYGPCARQDEEKLEKAAGQNFFVFDTNKLAQELKEVGLNRSVYIEKIFPASVSVSIEKRKAIAVLKTSTKKELYLADVDGEVIGQVTESFLPVLTFKSEEFGPGERLSGENLAALRVFHLVSKSQDVNQASKEQQALFSQTKDGVAFYLGLDRDPRVVVGALQLILTRSRIEGKLPKVADLRYSKPVLIY